MSDDIGLELHGADGARAMPAPARARLEEMLRSGSWRRPEQRVARAMAFEQMLEGIDGPRALPAGVRARLERSLAPRRRVLVQRVIGAAAVVLLLASSGAIVFRPDAERAPDIATDPNVPRGLPPPFAPTAPGADSGGTQAGFRLPPIPAPGGTIVPDDAPPFAFEYAVDAPALSRHSGQPKKKAVARPPLHIGVIRGDPEVEAGFDRYVDVLNDAGGIRGGRVRLVDVSADDPAPERVVATVNLSARAISSGGPPAWTRGPVLETLAVTEDAQRGRARSFASPPERQGHLIADQMYPTPVEQPTTAVIYHESDPLFGEVVPDAIEAVLDARGVTTIRVEHDPSQPVFIPADAAFLSLRASRAAQWFSRSSDAAYQPARGIGGIYTLMDPSLRSLIEGRDVRIATPFARPPADPNAPVPAEVRAMAGDAAFFSDERAHGWLTAKSLAVAIWLRGTDRMQRALAALRGYDTVFTPPYETREGSNARTPEAIVLAYQDGRYVAQSEFLRDPF